MRLAAKLSVLWLSLATAERMSSALPSFRRHLQNGDVLLNLLQLFGIQQIAIQLKGSINGVGQAFGFDYGFGACACGPSSAALLALSLSI